MAREDYLMRVIRQFVQALVHVRALRAGRQDYAALDVIRQTAGQLLDLPETARTTLSLREVVAQLPANELSPASRDKRIALATLLAEAGSIYTAQNRLDDRYACYLQSLHLILGAVLQDPAQPLPEHAPAVETLAAALASYSLPFATNARLMQYYEQAGAYAKAEDVLYAMRAAEPGNLTTRALGRAFYHRLLRQPDEALRAGNLPRDEVEEGLAGLVD